MQNLNTGQRHPPIPTINARQAAEELGISHQRVCQLLNMGRIQGARKKGRGWLIPPDPKVIPSVNTGRKQPPPGYVQVTQAAIELKVSTGMVRQYIGQGRIPGAVKLGRHKWIMPTPVQLLPKPKRQRPARTA